jgi:Fungal domain of unknown function (DUF1746)
MDEPSAAPISFQRRIDTIGQLLQNLDTIILLEIAISFYSDNSFALLGLRVVSYVSFVSPKPASTNSNLQIIPVLLANLLCFILHVFAGAPQSVEGGSYGYLYGAIIINIVGEPVPPRWRLIFLDLMMAAVQVVMLALTWENERLKGKNDTAGVRDDTQQNLEAEEAGMRNSHPTDKFYTSEYMAVELDVVHCLKALWSKPRTSSATPGDGGVIESVLARLVQRQ